MRQAATSALIALMATAAAAQDAAEEDAARGLRLGSVIVRPVAQATTLYDDNIFRQQGIRRASVIQQLRAAAEAETDWTRHSLRVKAEIEAGFYARSGADDYLDAGMEAEGVLDISRAARLRARAGVARGHEMRGSDDAPVALAGPIKHNRVYADLTGQYARGRIRVQPYVGAEKIDYEDERLAAGGVADQDDRDRMILHGGVKLVYAPPGAVEYFTEGELRRTDFDDPFDRAGVDRDSTQYRILAGVSLAPRGKLSGSAAAGWRSRRFGDPSLRDVSGPALRAGLSWTPTQLLELGLNARRLVEETTVAGASSAVVTGARLTAVYEVRRFLDLMAEAAYERRSFRGAGRVDETLAVGAGLVWRARRGLSLRAAYRYVDESSDAPGESSRAHQVWVAAEYRF